MKIKSDYLNSISKVITYYEFFGYAPSISETHKFLNCNIPKPKFLQLIKGFAKKKKIIVSNNRIAFSSKIIKRSLDQEFRANRLLKQAKPSSFKTQKVLFFKNQIRTLLQKRKTLFFKNSKRHSSLSTEKHSSSKIRKSILL